MTGPAPGEPRLLAGQDDGPLCPLTVGSNVEIPQAWCAHCREERNRTRRRIRRRSLRTDVIHRCFAQQPGTCWRCGDPYQVDDYIGITAAERRVCGECC